MVCGGLWWFVVDCGGLSFSHTRTRCKNLALYIYIRDCESLCLSDETVKAVGPFYLVSMPGEVKLKDPTQGVNVYR